ncbi:putative tetratricopeptide-like helical domain-containing protein [Medicago truncatula]|uniref:Pentatricopeptide (PPR) repeat protein n=1 Tax=Medicago truncatula TaxID=3880 RepID=G7L219_MEDTR|nr:pentatricopeptide repeat-containing protein At5g15300 [Medicago truncatula]AES77482.1 pentatricopeptide (PPR) repeat protein [Medicago truncatula]RHN44281.1 putative tetratricopeptide-like helical domain-containing protein [Medicago truncatula]
MFRKRIGFKPTLPNLKTLKQIHALMIINGFNNNVNFLGDLVLTISTSLVGPTATPTVTNYAHQLFAQIPQPDTFMYNVMIRGSSQSPNPLRAISLYTEMHRHFVKGDSYTFPFVLKACTRLFWVNTGSAVHGMVLRLGFGSNAVVRNTLLVFHAKCGDLNVATSLFDDSCKGDVVAWSSLIAGYARRGDLKVARKLFNEMPERDLVSWNVMITGYVKQGEMESARMLFDEAPVKDVVSWNAMIAGYVVCGLSKQALELFNEMCRAGVFPDEVTLLSLLSACADLGDLENGKKVHAKVMEISMGKLSTLLGNALIDMYAKCGNIKESLDVFWSITDKDVISWNSVIVGMALHGHGKESLSLFKMMQRTKICPNEITFVGVLVACSHAGEIDEGYKYFDLMSSEYKIEPNIRHCGCMVDMLGRAGLLKEAAKFIDSMKIEPNAIIWRTLLAACKVHGDVELAKVANEKLFSMRKDHSGDYVLMSNLYASRGEWDGAEKVRKLMDDSGVTKIRGSSFVEACN